MWLDCSFIEHICLTLKLAVFVKNFKCREQREGTVITESRTIGSAVYQSVFLSECVIQIVQLFLCPFNLLIGIIFFLYFNKGSNAVTNGNHTLDSVLSSCRYYGRGHTGVLTEIDFIVQYSIGKVPHRWVCRDRIIFFIKLICNLIFRDFSVNIDNSFIQQLSEVCVFKCFASCFRSETTRYHFHLAQYHFRVLNKI